ncbi:Peptide transporter PTR2 [Hyphodiscus hymeniophilus]|uniref:Peptide transporter PTR2 n=1 Tax=Hyphodiscus hymeniophilus TaxID=353542 RepID=A0A9P7AXX3_9HELO|nr:Peptide transporter PTR2 [Hyphodiscus hymeniophilus]
MSARRSLSYLMPPGPQQNTRNSDVGILHISNSPGFKMEPSVFATSVPPEVAEPHGRSSYAPIDAIGQPDHDKSLVEAHDIRGDDDDLEYPRPTEEEMTSLRKVSDKIPASSFVLCAVEFAELSPSCWGNGAGAPPKGSQQTAGALNKGEQFSNAFVLLFQFLAYVIPIFGAWWADTRLGRYKVIAVGVLVCGIAHLVLIFGAIPSVLQGGHAMAPYLIGFFILAFGAGIFKPNITPTILDQYQHQRQFVKVLKSGEKVIVDPETTIQRMMLIFYGLINVGAFFALATTYSEKDVGYWLAYLTPGIIYFLLPILLILNYKRTIKIPPSDSAYDNVFAVIWIALKKNTWRLGRKGFWDPARPSVMRANGITEWRGNPIPWDDNLVDDVQRTFSACQIFLYFAVYNNNDGGIGSVATSQAATMTTNGAPNDLLGNFNPLTIIVTIPTLSYVIYPLLRRYKIRFGRISRITFGFTLAWISGIIGAIVQWRIYETSPCGWHAGGPGLTGCTIGTGVSPLSVWLQIPNVALGAISECFCWVTAYELAYARSPKSMRSLVMAIFLFTNALSAALGEAITPAIRDPHLIWVWAGPAIALFVLTIHFYFTFRHLDNDEFMSEHNETFVTNHEKKNQAMTKGEEAGQTSEGGEGGDEKTAA